MTLTLEHKKYLGGAAALIVFLLLIHSFILAVKRAQLVNACERAFGPLDATQKDSIRLIVKAFEKYGDKDQNKLIYILATARHESNFRPIEEYRSNTAQQNAYWYTGYYGRGFVQLTHEKNYLKMSNFLGVDLVKNPSLALEPNYAAKILVYGMMEGQFTRKPLSNYIDKDSIDFYSARKVVNGLDKAEKIANYAQSIQSHII